MAAKSVARSVLRKDPWKAMRRVAQMVMKWDRCWEVRKVARSVWLMACWKAQRKVARKVLHSEILWAAEKVVMKGVKLDHLWVVMWVKGKAARWVLL